MCMFYARLLKLKIKTKRTTNHRVIVHRSYKHGNVKFKITNQTKLQTNFKLPVSKELIGIAKGKKKNHSSCSSLFAERNGPPSQINGSWNSTHAV